MLHSAVPLRRSQDTTFNRTVLRDAAAAEHGTIKARQTLRALSVSLGREVRNFRGQTSGDYADFANALEADYTEAAALYHEFQAVNPLDPVLVDLDGYMREVRRALAAVLKDARSAVDTEIGAHRQFQDFAKRATARTQAVTRAASARPRTRGPAPKSLDLDGAAKGRREPMPSSPRAPKSSRGQSPEGPPSSIQGAQTAFRQRMAGAFRTPSMAEGLETRANYNTFAPNREAGAQAQTPLSRPAPMSVYERHLLNLNRQVAQRDREFQEFNRDLWSAWTQKNASGLASRAPAPAPTQGRAGLSDLVIGHVRDRLLSSVTRRIPAAAASRIEGVRNSLDRGRQFLERARSAPAATAMGAIFGTNGATAGAGMGSGGTPSSFQRQVAREEREHREWEKDHWEKWARRQEKPEKQKPANVNVKVTVKGGGGSGGDGDEYDIDIDNDKDKKKKDRRQQRRPAGRRRFPRSPGLSGTTLGRGAGALGAIALGSEMIEDTFFRTPEERLKVIGDRAEAANKAADSAAESYAPDWMNNAFGWGKYREQGPVGQRWLNSLWGSETKAATVAPSMTVAPASAPMALGTGGPGFSLSGPGMGMPAAEGAGATVPAPEMSAEERRAQRMRDRVRGRTPISINGRHVGYMDAEGIHVENEADRALVEKTQGQFREQLGMPSSGRQVRIYGDRESGNVRSDVVKTREATTAEMGAPVATSSVPLGDLGGDTKAEAPTPLIPQSAVSTPPADIAPSPLPAGSSPDTILRTQRTIGERPAGSLARPLDATDGEDAVLEYLPDGSYRRSTPNSTRTIGTLRAEGGAENQAPAGATAPAAATVAPAAVIPPTAGTHFDAARAHMMANVNPELAALLGPLWDRAEAGPAASVALEPIAPADWRNGAVAPAPMERIAPVDFGHRIADDVHNIGGPVAPGGTTTVRAEQFNIVLPDDSARTFAWALIEAIDKYFKNDEEGHNEQFAGDNPVGGAPAGTGGAPGTGGGGGSGTAGAAPGDSQNRSGAQFGWGGGDSGGTGGGGAAPGAGSSSGSRFGSGGASSGAGPHGQSQSRGGRGSPRAQQERAAARGKEDAELKGREDAANTKAAGAKSRIEAADKELAAVEAARAGSGPMDQAGLDNRRRKAETAKAGAQKDLDAATAEQGAVGTARQEIGRRRAAEDTAAAAAPGGRAGKSGGAGAPAAPPKPTADVSGMGDLPGISKPVPGTEGQGAMAEGDHLGKLSSTYEGKVESANKDNIGHAYGKYQFNDTTGGLKQFFKSNPEYAAKFSDVQPGTEAFAERWKQVAREDRKGFEGAQDKAAKDRWYNPQEANAKEKGYKLEDRGVQEAVFSGSIQHGKVKQIIDRAAQAPGFKDMDAAGQVKEFYKARRDYVNGLSSLSPAEKAGQMRRYEKEEAKALKDYVGKPAAGSGPQMSPGVNPKAATAADLKGIDEKLKGRLAAGNLNEADRAKIEAQRAELGTHIGKLEAQEKTQTEAAAAKAANPATAAPTAGLATMDSNGRMSTPSVTEKQAGARIRKLDIQDGLREQLQYAAEKTGLEVDVGSGGQMSLEEARKKGARQVGKEWYLPDGTPVRTGSVRHDNGGAADVRLYTRDAEGKRRQLDMTNPADAERMHAFTKHSVAAGATGVGGGVGYMGTGTLHIGGGEANSWGGAEWIERARREGVDARKTGEFAAWKEKKLAEAKAKEEAAKSGKPVAGGTAGAEKTADAQRVRQVDEDFHAGHAGHDHGPNGHSHGPGDGHKHEPQGTVSAERKAAWAGKENPFTRGRKPGEAKAADGAAAKIEPANTGRAADAGPVDNSVPAILRPQRSAKVAAPEKAVMPENPDQGPKGAEAGPAVPAAPEKAAIPAPNDSGPKNAAAEAAAAQKPEPKKDEGSTKPATAAYADGAVIHERSVIDRGAGYSAQIAERGPEAIMPLERGPDGRLGVSVASAETGSAMGATASAENDNPQAFAPQQAAFGSSIGREEDRAGAGRRERYVPPEARTPPVDPSRGASAAMGQAAPSMSTTGRGGNGEAPPSMTMMPSRIPDYEMQALLSNSA